MDRPGGDINVECRRLELSVPEQHLYDPETEVILAKMSPEAAAQCVQAGALTSSCRLNRFLDNSVQLPCRLRSV
jgi:hypothetical protein